MMKPSFSISSLPSIVWVFLLPLALIAFIGSIILIFWLLASVEGFASVLMLAIFVFIVWGTRGAYPDTTPKEAGAGLITGLGICFFALMGMAIDQPGNYLYNKPLEWLFCPANSTLSRGIDVSHPLPGRTDITQDFNCISMEGKIVKRISPFEIMSVRFGEYVMIAYAVLGVVEVRRRVRAR